MADKKKYKSGSIADVLGRITIRVTLNEKQELKEKAIEKGITLNELIKRKLTEVIK